MEGNSTWTTEEASAVKSGNEFSVTLTGLTPSTDYMYYAYVVVDGHEICTATYGFRTDN